MNLRPLGTAALTSALLWGCSSSPSESGGGFEGETISFAGKVRFHGTALARAAVTFVDPHGTTGIVSGSTDDSGTFHLRVPATASGRLEVRAADTALYRGYVDGVPDSTLPLEALAARDWKARAVLGGAAVSGAWIRALGSRDSVSTSADGSFTLLRSTTGREWVQLRLPDGTGRDLVLPPLTDSVLTVPDHPVLLVDDFEQGTSRAALGDALGWGWWYANDDSSAGGSSKVLPVGALQDIRAALSSADAFAGTSLSLDFQIDASQSVHFAQAGIVLVDTTRGWWMDLSKVDSITLMLKGSGNVRLQLVTRTNVEPTYDPAGMWGCDIALPSAWSRVVVRKSDIAIAAGSRPATQGIPWSTDGKHGVFLVLVATSAATFEVDDIQFHGPRLSELLVR
jgi:hypothetical protein